MSHQRVMYSAVALVLFALFVAGCSVEQERLPTTTLPPTNAPQPTASVPPTSTPIAPTAAISTITVPTTNAEPIARNVELVGHIGGEVASFAAPTPDYYYNASGLATDVVVQENHAYVVQGADGSAGMEWGRLSIVDVSTPTAPLLTSFYRPELIATSVVVVSGTAYLTDGQCELGAITCWGNLYILDTSDPTSPVLVGVYGLRDMQAQAPIDRSWFASEVAIRGSYAYIAGGPYHSAPDQGCGMCVVDISNAASPTVIGVMQCGEEAWGGHGIAVQGEYAYVAAHDNGLRIVDISNPASPREVGHITGIGAVWDVAVAGNQAYLTTDSGLQFVDIAEPTAPTLTASLGTIGPVIRAYVADDYAYVAAAYAGLRVIDVSNPTAPTEVAFYDTTGIVYGVTVANGYIYIADGEEGLLILRLVQGVLRGDQR